MRLGTLAVRYGCELDGDPDTEVSQVATLGNAAPGSISFLASPAYRSLLRDTKASAVILSSEFADDCPVDALVTSDPHLTFAQVANELYPRPRFPAGVHPSAVVDDAADVDPSAHVAALAVIESGARVGARVYVGPGTVVGRNCQVDDDAYLAANVTLVDSVSIGKRTILNSGAVIGSDGFGHKMTDTGWLKVPQVGGVRIGADVEIGASTTVDRGAIDDTVIEDGVRLDNKIQIAHNCRIGAHTLIASGTGVSGSTRIGARCVIAGHVGFVGHITICDNVVITGGAVVTKDITKPGVYSGAWPAEEDRAWKRRVARTRRLDSFEKRLRKLEGRIDEE
ncbi:MAG: UDP-3-O-(3-hydroxymyristoyl)glucosamine N-acyltransferase [Woeseiaceae bacterium]|nr:UDP-3-O-(3-hydroxymyristoyl)glucosamine N-acyltransferase [Woeseiaceae bacterium]